MCGIAGVTQREDVPFLDAALDLVRYRGPDDGGTFTDETAGVGLGMRRLAILDLQGGRQPMEDADLRLCVVFNGEIFNAPELRRDLEARGHRFRTRNSDTEVLLRLYADRGPDMLRALNGMFAFVIYDRSRRRLFGARDRMGIKPFYYACKAGRFAFSSELKCLLLLPWVSRELDFASLYHYLSLQFTPAPGTVLQDVSKLPAGHSFTFDLLSRQLSVQRYWQLPIEPDHERSLADWRDAIRATMERAVRRWTLSDVPVACSLSGGLDSSAIVGLLARQGYGKLRTYSLGFEEEHHSEYCELRLARKVAEKWQTDHHEIVLRAESVLDDLDSMVWHLDEPYAGGLPSWYVFKAIGRDCKVALTGTGGDELFGNYGKWRTFDRALLPRLSAAVRDALCRTDPGELLNAVRFQHGHFYHRYFTDREKDGLLFGGERPRGAVSTEAFLEDAWRDADAANPRDAVARIDFQMQLPEEFLLMTDRFSMAHSVEARPPLLDHELVELVFRIPAAQRTRPDDLKYLLRDVVQDVLPPELLAAPKRGFILPLPQWTRGTLKPLIEELLAPSYLRSQGLFAPELWNAVVAPHLSGRTDRTAQVWTLLMFQLWWRRYCLTDTT